MIEKYTHGNDVLLYNFLSQKKSAYINKKYCQVKSLISLSTRSYHIFHFHSDHCEVTNMIWTKC